jgi:hypothetical protein
MFIQITTPPIKLINQKVIKYHQETIQIKVYQIQTQKKESKINNLLYHFKY